MKIGIDCRFWNESGVGRYVRNLIEQLQVIDKKNNYVLFIHSRDHQKFKVQSSKFKDNENWKIVPTDIHWHSFGEQVKFPRILNKENLDLMHFPYFSIPVFYNRPFIVTIHDLILHHVSTGEATTRHPLIYLGKRLAYKFILNRAAQKSKKIITVSQSTKDEIIDHLNILPEKIIVTYEGITKGKIDKIKAPDKFIFHVGNLYPHKNMDLVLDALRKIRDEENISIPLIIAGKVDHFYTRFQEKVRKLGLDRQVSFLGEVSDPQLQFLYQKALALVSPSLMEGFDLPTVEAMANDCLVIASDIPAHSEICRDACVYFNPEKEDDLILKLKEIYEKGKEKYKDKIKKGRALSAQFSWQKMARETLKIYESCISL